jgi:uncharacterized protein (DUF1778 family)
VAKETHTPPSSLRIPTDVKEAAQRRAAAEGKTLTDVVVAYLRRYGLTLAPPTGGCAP